MSPAWFVLSVASVKSSVTFNHCYMIAGQASPRQPAVWFVIALGNCPATGLLLPGAPPEVPQQGHIHLMLKVRLVHLQEPSQRTFGDKDGGRHNGRLSLRIASSCVLAERQCAKGRLRNPFSRPPLFSSFVISSTDKYLLAKATAAVRTRGRLLCTSLAPLPSCVSLCLPSLLILGQSGSIASRPIMFFVRTSDWVTGRHVQVVCH